MRKGLKLSSLSSIFFTIVVAILGLLAYMSGMGFLGSIRSDYIPMAPSTAICFIILATILWTIYYKQLVNVKAIILMIAALLVSLFGVLEIAEFFTGIDLNLEDSLIPAAGSLNGIPIARMSSATGAAFFLSGFAVFLLIIQRIFPERKSLIKYSISGLGLIVLIISFVFILAYLYDNPLFYGLGATIPMALTTAIGFVTLSISILTSNSGAFPIILLTGTATRNYLLRFILPLTMLAVIVSGIVMHISERATTINPAFISAALTILIAVLVGIVATIISNHIGTKIDNVEEVLKENSAILKESQKLANLGSYSLDILTGIWTSSEILDSIFGIDNNYRKDVKGWVDLIHPDEQNEMHDYFNNHVLGKRRHFDKEYRIIPKNSQNERWVHGLGRLDLDSNGQPVRMIGTIQDITRRKQTMEALKESEEKFRNLADNSPNMIFINQRGKVVYVNNLCSEITGYTLDEFYSNDFDFRTLIHPEHLEVMMSNFNLHMKRKNVPPSELTVMTKSGEQVETLLNTKLITTAEGLAILGIMTDITERKKAELELTRNYKQQILLTQVSHLFTKLGQFDENMQEVLRLIGEEVNVSRVYIFEDYKEGKFAKNTYEWCNKEVVPQIDNLQEVPYEIIPSWKDLLLEKERVLTSNIFELPQDLIDILEPQEIKAIIVYPIYVMNQFFGFIGFDECTHNRNWENNEIELLKTVTNIISTLFERKQAETQRAEALLKAEKANDVKDLFLANMSHELRTPLNSLLGFVEIIEDSLKDRVNKEETEFFQIIQHSGKRLIKTVHGVLDITQIETGTILFSREIMPLAHTVEQIYKALKPQAEAKKLKLTFDNQIADGCIKADESLLIKAVSNLVENAVKYTEAGDIVLTLFEQVGHYVLSIRDTGIGMSPDYMKHMYDTFTQESSGYTKKYQGLGLGLSIAKRCLDLMEIAIDVESKKGVGTTFKLTFTRKEEVIAVADKHVEAIPKVIEAVDIARPMVLIVEDDENNRKVLEVQLKSTYHTCYAVSVEGAKKQLKDHAVDLVLPDLSLEGDKRGLDLVAYMKTKDDLKGIPIIAVTAQAFTHDRENALNAGCDDYMSKPINKKKLLKMMKQYV